MRLKAIQALAIMMAIIVALSVSLAAQAPAGGGQGRGGGGGAPGGGPGGPGGGGQGRGGGARGPAVQGLTLTSTAWQDGGEIPLKNAGMPAGQSISPALAWSNAPMGTVEYILIMNDPEPVTPRGSATGDILHWMVAKIPATATGLPEGAGNPGGAMPAGAKQVQTYRGPGAGAAGPQHHYTLTLYALSAPLELTDNATRADVMTAMEGKVLGRGIFNGRFKQPAPAPAP